VTQPPSSDTAAAILGAASLAFWPELGHFSLVFFGALIGCMHSVGKVDHAQDKWAAFWYMARWIGTACVLTGAATALLVQYVGVPADRWPGCVAFVITFLADKWPAWLEAFGPQWLQNVLKKTP
jgi:hypothetical protein